jgi:hypothetical protein
MVFFLSRHCHFLHMAKERIPAEAVAFVIIAGTQIPQPFPNPVSPVSMHGGQLMPLQLLPGTLYSHGTRFRQLLSGRL